MAIRLETSKKTRIDNFQDEEMMTINRSVELGIIRSYANAILRTRSTPIYNCHGLTFGSRRTNIIPKIRRSHTTDQIRLILSDDSFREIVDLKDVMAGDIVLYMSEDETDINHSGIVVAAGKNNGSSGNRVGKLMG